jgi:hypothetical protein
MRRELHQWEFIVLIMSFLGTPILFILVAIWMDHRTRYE